MRTAIILISQAGLPTAQRIADELGDAVIASTTTADCVTTVGSLSSFVADSFNSFDAFVFVGALGICVRTIAPCLQSKYSDPAVVCVDSTGRYAIAVASGHIGGANELTERIARLLGAEAVVTTQSDRTGLWALDLLPEKFGWKLRNPASEVRKAGVPTQVSRDAELGNLGNGSGMNGQIALFVAGRPTVLLLELRDRGTDWLEAHLPAHVSVAYRYEEIDFSRFELLIAVSAIVRPTYPIPAVVYLPPAVHIGVGLARMASPVDKVISGLKEKLREQGVDWLSVASVSTITLKENEPVIQALRQTLPLHLYAADELGAVSVPTPSPVVEKHVGTSSVSEAAALLTAGGSQLLVPKQKGSNFTVAAAVDSRFVRHGHVEIVGAGPGDPELISLRGRRMLEQADLILYAGSLVPRQLTLCAKQGAVVRSSASMTLDEQFELMKAHYDRGHLIVRLHTGDPCIYGAIQEQMNYFDRYSMSYHITPGISSFQAAAAALKSQFTIPERVQTIILTRGEGRTPMPEREKLHLLARSRSTICIFLSASIAREVQDELLLEYPADTPVAVCYHLTWDDERLYRGELKDLARIVEDHGLTLTTLIVVGEAIGNREGLSRLYASEFSHRYRTGKE